VLASNKTTNNNYSSIIHLLTTSLFLWIILSILFVQLYYLQYFKYLLLQQTVVKYLLQSCFPSWSRRRPCTKKRRRRQRSSHLSLSYCYLCFLNNITIIWYITVMWNASYSDGYRDAAASCRVHVAKATGIRRPRRRWFSPPTIVTRRPPNAGHYAFFFLLQ